MRRRPTDSERMMRVVLARRKRADYNARRRAVRLGAQVVEDVSRDALIARDGQVCYLCDEWISIHEVTFDHVVPLSKGGTHTASNIRIAHRACNSRKGKKILSGLGFEVVLTFAEAGHGDDETV